MLGVCLLPEKAFGGGSMVCGVQIITRRSPDADEATQSSVCLSQAPSPVFLSLPNIFEGCSMKNVFRKLL